MQYKQVEKNREKYKEEQKRKREKENNNFLCFLVPTYNLQYVTLSKFNCLGHRDPIFSQLQELQGVFLPPVHQSAFSRCDFFPDN